MAILGQKDSEIEVRLQKLPINNEHNSKAYFDEYALVGKKDKSTKSVVRFILPGECTYAIEITLKKGFVVGDDGLAVRLWDKKSSKLFHERTLFCSLPHGGQKTLNTDKIYFVKSISEWLIAEGGKNDSPITFYVLRPDKPPIAASKVSSHVVKTVESLEVELIRYSAPRLDRIYEARPEEVEFGQRMKRYEPLAKVLRSDVQAQDRSGQAAAIGRERHVNYGSVTPATRLIGSAEAGTLLKPPERYYTSESTEHMFFKFFVRTAKFMDKHDLAKTTPPQELQHWDTLNDAQRKACFKLLQDADKKMTEEQKYKEADARTEAEKNKIYKLLFHVGISPDRWRPFDILYVRERKILFEELQTRRKFFERGESPPEHAMTKSSPRTPPSNGRILNAKPSSTASAFSSNTLTRNPKPSAPVILINEDDDDDDDPDDKTPLSIRRGFLKSVGPSSIKSEPAETALRRPVIDVDAYPDLDEQNPKRAVASPYNVDDTSPSKRVKLEPGNSPRTLVDENAELQRLMEQSERDEELLRQEQRVAERMRILNETKARIAEMEARKNSNGGTD